MRLSVIVPFFNGLAHSQTMLRGLFASLPPGIETEILLVDDGSTDGTREWLQEIAPTDARLRLFLQPKNSGYAAANNLAARAAKGDVLALLNSDLVLAPGWCEPMLHVLACAPGAGFVGNVQTAVATGATHHTGIYFNAWGKPRHDTERPHYTGPWREVPAVTAACVMVRRELFLQLGGFDEGFVNGGEDVDLCLRARAAGRRNYVALISRVGHHVSASPGRSRFKERNGYRLLRRWQHHLPALALAAWSDPHLRWRWEKSLRWPHSWRAVLLRAFGSSSAGAMHYAVTRTLAWQLARWEREFPDLRNSVAPEPPVA